MTVYLKYVLFMLYLATALQVQAQAGDDDAEFNISVKPGMLQTKTYFNPLQMDYTDQATPPNHLQADFSIGNNPVLYGGEVSFGSRLFRNGFYFDGLGFGFYVNKGTLFQYNSGLGYGLRFNKKWKLIAAVSAGYSAYDKLLSHHYFTAAGPLVINGKILDNNYQLDLLHNMVYLKPIINLQYQIKFMSIQVFGGYQFTPVDKETIHVTEYNGLVYTRPRSARISPHDSIKANGQYISGKMMSLSGLTIGAGIVFNVYY